MKKVIVILTLLSSASVLQAVSITYSATGSARPVDASNNFLPVGALVRLGNFTPGFDFATNGTNLSALNAAFTEYATVFTTAPGQTPRPGTIDGTANVTGILGKQLYMWIFNTAAADTASQWGIFTYNSPAWLAGGDEATDSTSIGLGSASNPGFTIDVKVGSTFLNGTTTTGKLAVIEAIPEPSTYALMGLGLVVVGFLARRRK